MARFFCLPDPSLPPLRLLAVRRGALGDFILTLPALRALRVSRPGAEIHLLTLPAYGAFAGHFGFADGWRSLEAAPAAALFREGAALEESWREWLAGFDEIISWLPDRDGVFQRRLAACSLGKFHQAPWLADGSGPAARQFGTVCGISAAGHVRLPFGNNAENHLEKPANPASPLIALHPGSGSPRKNWPMDHWLQVMQHFQQREPAIRWRIVTGEAEQDGLDSLHAVLNQAGLPWEPLHELPLTDLARRLQECRVFLGHDSGVAHLAAACGVPCRILFGPTDPAVWAPLGEPVRILRAHAGDWSLLRPETVMDWLENTWPWLPFSGAAP